MTRVVDPGAIRLPRADQMARAMTERELLRAVVDYAHLRGWLVHHCRPALDGSGHWATHIQGDAGFVDLVLLRRGVIHLVELKSETGKLSPAQDRWVDAAYDGEQVVPYWVWKPVDWRNGTIERVLR